jgi:hypothetical protein
MTKSFVGKILRGIGKVTSRNEVDTFDIQGKIVDKKVDFECDDGEISIRFISIVCNDCNQYDYNVEMNIGGNIIPCIATVYKNGNIQIATHGKFPYKSLIMRIDIRILLIKCKGKYKYELGSDNIDELTYDSKEKTSLPKQEFHGTTLFKTGSFKFSRY